MSKAKLHKHANMEELFRKGDLNHTLTICPEDMLKIRKLMMVLSEIVF